MVISNKKNKLNFKKIFKKIFFIVLGNALCAIAFNMFFAPNKLLSGGVGGISLMLQYLKDIPSGITMFAINIPIYIIGYKMIDRDFALYSLVSTFVLSGLLTLFRGLNGIIEIDDILVGAIVGGVLNGTGMGIIFRNKASQGGLDIVAMVLKKKYNINISSGLMMLNTVIITCSSFLFGIRPAVYTLISMYLGYYMVDRVQTGLNIRKSVLIITENHEEIGNAIIENIGRGVTYIEAEGGYSKHKKKMVYCIVLSKEVVKLKDIVEKTDPAAFLTITDVVEVEGRGFRDIEA